MTRTRDLTVGSIPAHFRGMAVPAAIGMVFSTLYNVVDIYFAGLLDSQAQAGLSIAHQAFFLFVAVGIGLGAAMGALVGGAIGRKDKAIAGRTAAQGIAYGLVASALLILCGAIGGPYLIAVITEPGTYRDGANAYFLCLILGTPGFVLALGSNGILQALGDTRSMQYALIAAFFANIGLNPLFMWGIPSFWEGFGLNGIAIATVVSQTSVMAYVLWRVMKSNIARDLGGKAFWPRIVDFKQITAQLLPTGLAIFVMIAAGMVVQYYLKRFGPAAVAAYGVALRVEQLFLLPVFGLTGALLPIAAQNFGAGFATRTRKALFDCWIFGWIFMLVMCPILWVAAPTLMQVFTNDADVVDIGVSYLRIDGMLLPAYMMLFAVNSFLQALRKPGWTLWIGLYRQAFGVAFFVWIFVNHFGLGVLGVWYGIAASVLTGLVLSLIIVQKVCKPLIGSLFWGRKASAPDGTQ